MPPKFVSFRLHIKATLIFLLNGVFCLSEESVFAQSQTNTTAVYNKVVPVIELKGDSYHRGLKHGTQLKKDIAAVFAKWKESIRRDFKGDPDSVLGIFLKSSNFEPSTRKYTPGILDEIRGIADGSAQSYADVFAFQLIDEYWVYLNKYFHSANHHCSSIGVPATADHPAYIAQNMDLENYMQGFQVLLHLAATATEPEQYILSCAGSVALNGMNEKGIALCMNTLMDLQASTDGLPVAFVIRGVLSKQNGNEAMEFLKSVKHASGQNYILGITDSVYDFEASANQVIRFLPKEGKSSLVYHTNHALVNRDVKEWFKSYHQKMLAGETKNNNSETRFASLEGRLNKLPNDISTDVIKLTLRSKDNEMNPICSVFKENGWGFTFSSVLFTLGGKRSVQVTHGSPDQSEYKEYFFKNIK